MFIQRMGVVIHLRPTRMENLSEMTPYGTAMNNTLREIRPNSTSKNNPTNKKHRTTMLRTIDLKGKSPKLMMRVRSRPLWNLSR